MSKEYPVIEVENISKTFRAPDGGGRIAALRDISFKVAPREVLGVVGKSGAGKTTLLRVLSLQMPPDSGRLNFGTTRIDEGTPGSVVRDVMRRTSTVFQGFSLLYNRSVLENVALPLKLRNVARAERTGRAREMLDFVGLGTLADVYPITLSGGEAQRVAIARALVTDPEVLFLDEPTSALDAQTSGEILDLLKKVQGRYPMAMILVAHHMDVVRYMCDRVLHLEGGTVRRLGPIRNTAQFRVDPIEALWDAPQDV
ncbi:ATP-binding cassette domain-containing protein [Sinirhodobacter populi]|uniref:ATP-binding cassette domain-containing protein n=1 Tax=Paenirhodobacter populi TaxID=2306993 RepID=A0A443K096_9RHOB|nr:ATP-binding cassette domain-containing protein [Sinirhodobacter populi]RWR26135.1 ATP-binding cassette domain-containing protein [Sinirhodobacter populi]